MISLTRMQIGVALPYKWRTGKLPKVVVRGPTGMATCKIVDVGPWNIDNPEYVLQGKRPLVERQYIDRTPAQNGRVPVNDAGVDLTPAAARAVGISGKGKVSVEIERAMIKGWQELIWAIVALAIAVVIAYGLVLLTPHDAPAKSQMPVRSTMHRLPLDREALNGLPRSGRTFVYSWMKDSTGQPTVQRGRRCATLSTL